VTGLASSTSMRCEVNRRPGIGTVRNESAAEVTARYRHGAALSLLYCDSSQFVSWLKLDSTGTVPLRGRASSRRQADGLVSAAELRASTTQHLRRQSEWPGRLRSAARMAESNPAATGLASSTSMRCEVNRRPGDRHRSYRERCGGHREMPSWSSALASTLRFLTVACRGWNWILWDRCRFGSGIRPGGEPGSSSGPPSYGLRPVCALLRQRITRWVLRVGRFRGLATQPVKRAAWEGRGNPCADLAVSSGTS